MEKKMMEILKYLFKSSKAVIYVVLIVMFAATVILLSASEPVSMTFNLVFLVLMAVLIFIADVKGIQVLERIAGECRNIIVSMEQLSVGRLTDEERKSSVWEELRKDGSAAFSDPVLNRNWIGFCAKKDPVQIGEMLSEDLVMERSRKGYCEMVPGFLTALGILGTFLGLVMSMESFSFGSADQIETTMENLVGGIHVAFYTSIYGVALSIVYNIVYRGCVQNTCDEIFELHQTVRRKLPSLKKESGEERLAELGQEELVVLQRIENVLGRELGKEFGEAVGIKLEPVFAEINQSLKRVIGDFRAEQSESLNFIVEAFVKQMSERLDSHINLLGENVDRLSRSQEKMTAELNGLLQEISRTAHDTGKINEASEKILFRFETYMERLNSMQGHVNNTFGIVENYTKKLYDSMDEQRQMLSMMQEHEKEIIAACSSLEQIQKDFARQTEANLSVTEKMAGYQEEFRQNLTSVLQTTGNYEQKMFEILTEQKSLYLSVISQTQKTLELMREERKEGEKAAEEYQKKLELERKQSDEHKREVHMAENAELLELQMQTNQLLCRLVETMQEKNEQTFLKRCGSRIRNIRLLHRKESAGNKENR